METWGKVSVPWPSHNLGQGRCTQVGATTKIQQELGGMIPPRGKESRGWGEGGDGGNQRDEQKEMWEG